MRLLFPRYLRAPWPTAIRTSPSPCWLPTTTPRPPSSLSQTSSLLAVRKLLPQPQLPPSSLTNSRPRRWRSAVVRFRDSSTRRVPLWSPRQAHVCSAGQISTNLYANLWFVVFQVCLQTYCKLDTITQSISFNSPDLRGKLHESLF